MKKISTLLIMLVVSAGTLLANDEPTCHDYLFQEEAFICEGNSYYWRGNYYSIDSVYYDSLKTVEGCDSVYELALTLMYDCRTVSLNTNGNGYINGSGFYQEGSTITIEAFPYNGYHFVQWLDSVTDNPRTIVLTQDTTFTAEFAPNIYTLTISSSDETKGTVNTEINGEYEYGTYVNLEAVAKEGYSVLSWSDGNGYFCQGSVSRSYRITSDVELIANFGVQEPKTGTCGDSLNWSLDCDGVLTISGKGAMADYGSEKNTPWYNNDSHMGAKGYLPIRSVVIEEGVTRVGNYAFRNCSTIVSIYLPNTLTSIGQEAFRRAAITSLTIPSSVTTIEASAFYDCANLSTVTCYAVVPPTNERESRFFTSSYNFALHVPCGSEQAYTTAYIWKYWTPVGGAFDYSVGDAFVSQEPTCLNNSTLIFQAEERAGYFFTQWSDGNIDNPRTVQLVEGNHFEVVPEYIEGVKRIVCKGEAFVSPEDGQEYVITKDTVIGKYYLFVKTNMRPTLAESDYPIMQAGRIYYVNAEKALQKAFADANRFAPEITSIKWSYSIGIDKTANTYVSSEFLPSGEYTSAWVKYSAVTECGDVFADTFLVHRRETEQHYASSQLSTEGRDFWVALTLAVDPDASGAVTPFIAVSTKEQTTSTINNPNIPDWEIRREVGANEWIMFTTDDIPLNYWYPTHSNSFSAVESIAGKTLDLGIHLTTDKDVSVFAAQRRPYSYDAAFVLPTPVLQSEYYTQDYPPFNNNGSSYTEFTILATEDDTNIEITPTSTTADNHIENEKYVVTLNKGQTYYVLSKSENSLAGSHVIAQNGKKIAVFQGNTFTRIPNGGRGNRDCLYEQAMPLDYWGTQFVITRSLQKDANRIRVMAQEDGTELSIDGLYMATINRGETFEFELSIGDMTRTYNNLGKPIPAVVQQNASYLESTCPVAVYLYDVGCKYQAQESESIPVSGDSSKSYGDPAMVWISPIEQRMKDITFGICGTDKTTRHFVNVVCRTEDAPLTKLSSALQHDISLEFAPVPGNPQYSYARKFLADDTNPMSEKVFRLTNENGFIAHVYGHGYDESYSYAVGAAAITQGIEVGTQTVVDDASVDNRFCVDEPLVFNAQIGTNIIDRIDWNFDDGTQIENGYIQTAHTYVHAGTYNVQARIYAHKECPFVLYEPDDFTFTIQVGKPDTLRHEFEMCQGEAFVYKENIYYAATTDTMYYGCDSVDIFRIKYNDCTTTPQENVEVSVTPTSATFLWPIIFGSYSYKLTIWADIYHTQRICTLTFSAAGILLNIDFESYYHAPARSHAPMKRAADEEVTSQGQTGLLFTITGLDPNNIYYYDWTALDDNNEVIESQEGSFSTGEDASTDLINQTIDSSPRKIVVNGQIYILRGDKTYTMQGQEVR